MIDLIINKLPNVSLKTYEIKEKISTINSGAHKGETVKHKSATAAYTPGSQSWVCYYNRWYCDGKKIIPKDFEITPTSLRWCFYGDGFSSWLHRKNLVSAGFSTNGFSRDDCIMFMEMLRSRGINARIETTRNVIQISKAIDVRKFFKFIGESEVESMKYKWKIPHYKNEARNN